jgi:hypothetical protein
LRMSERSVAIAIQMPGGCCRRLIQTYNCNKCKLLPEQSATAALSAVSFAERRGFAPV